MTRAAAAARHVDLLVIGAGPAGRRAAIAGARLGRPHRRGGARPRRGRLRSPSAPSTPRRATRWPPGAHAPCAPASGPPHCADLLWRTDRVLEGQRDAVRDQLRRERVEVIEGAARFRGPRAVEVASPHGTAWSPPTGS